MAVSRRNFLGWLGIGSLGAVARVAAASEARSAMPPQPASPDWDMSWVERVHRPAAVFDSPQPADGDALFRACMWRDQYREVYGTSAEAPVPILVLRHAAIPLVMNDAYWARFEAGKALKMKDEATKRWYTRSPIWRAASGGPPGARDYNLESFLAQGGIVLGCGVAFAGRIVSEYARKDGVPREEAEKRARADLLPGVILQPSGVFAALRAQDAGASYVIAS